MKLFNSLFLIVGLIFLSNPSSAQSKVDFISEDYQAALKKSKESQKQIMIMVHTDWCPHCTYMKEQVLTDPQVIETLNSNYVCLQVNADKPETKEIMNKFGVISFPAFLFIDSNENMLYNVVGEINKTDFLVEAKKSLNPRLQLPFLKAQYESDSLNGAKCLAYLNGIRRGIDKNKTSQIASTYLKSVNEAQMGTLLNWRILAYAVNDLDAPEFPLILKYRKEFNQVINETRYLTKINNAIGVSLKNDVTKLDSASYSKHKNMVRAIPGVNLDSLSFKYDMQMYERLKDWPKYNAIAKKMVSKMVWNEPSKINEIVSNYVRSISSTNDLKLAATWMNHSIQMNNNYESNYIQAKLYQKLKNLPEAIKYARDAKKHVVEMKIDPKNIDKLYTQLGIK